MAKAVDVNDILTIKYGKLTVVRYLETVYSGRNREHYYECDCDCGKKGVRVGRRSLLKGDTTSCGCAHKDAGNRVKESLVGQRFGRWTVIDSAPNRVSASGKTRSIMWLCRCDCGTEKAVGARALKTGMSTSCGCLQKERVSEALTDDLVGFEFGDLTVIARDGSSNGSGGAAKHAKWLCRCSCGNEISALGFSLKNGDTTSCGCRKSSKYEDHTEEYLQHLGFVKDTTYFREKTFPDLLGVGGGNLRFDFYGVANDGTEFVIECQGEQHFRPAKWYGGQSYFEKLKKHDAIKKEYCLKHGIQLIEVPYTDITRGDVWKRLNASCLKPLVPQGLGG